MDLDFLNFDAINKNLLWNSFDKYQAPEVYRGAGYSYFNTVLQSI